MAGFAKIRDIVDYSDIAGQYCYTSYFKTPAYSSAQTLVHDLAIAPGCPKQIYYDGMALTATLFDSTKGIWTGGNVSPATKHLSKVLLVSASTVVAPATFWLCDFLLYYPLIDLSISTEQVFDNTITLPRYQTGLGVKAFLVSTSAYSGTTQQFYIEYVDESGITKHSALMQLNTTGTVVGTFVSTATSLAVHTSPFLNTFAKGIRSVTKFKMTTTPATGLCALVLCKPLAMLMIRESTAAVEKSFILDAPSMPVILDGAHIQIFGAPNGNWNTVPILGEITTVWR